TVAGLTISTATTGSFAGLVDTSSNVLTILGNLAVNRGTFAARTSSVTVTGSWTITSPGAFTAGTSSVTFTGTGTGNTIVSGKSPFNILQFSSRGEWASATDPITVSSFVAMSGSSLTVTSVSSLTVAGGFTLTGGTLSLQGDLGVNGANFNNNGIITA